MEKIANKVFGGERPLFEIHNTELDHVRITFGESGVKECSNIVLTSSLKKYVFCN